jgi:ribosomal protein L11 methyltransferase
VNSVDVRKTIRRLNMLPETSRATATFVGRLATSEQAAHKISQHVADRLGEGNIAVSIAETGNATHELAVYFQNAGDKNKLRAAIGAAAGRGAAHALRFARLGAADWVGESLQGLAPVEAGRFMVHGAHDRGRVPINRIGIEIEAALAFGSGHHGTTRGCLLALDRMGKSLRKPQRAIVQRHPEARANGSGPKWPARRQAPRASKGDGPGQHPSRRAFRAHFRMTGIRILDIGTGSGVLAIAAARMRHRRVAATDVDADAVAVARENVRLNRAAALVRVTKADGVFAPGLSAAAGFDVIFANLLLRPLLHLASPLRRRIAPGGRIVLSGLLRAQANAVIAAYRPLVLESRIELDGWVTLVLARRRLPRSRFRRSGPYALTRSA